MQLAYNFYWFRPKWPACTFNKISAGCPMQMDCNLKHWGCYMYITFFYILLNCDDLSKTNVV